MRTGHHAIALDANGRSLPDKIWGWEMPVLADFSPCTYVLEDEPRPGCLTRRTVPVWDDSIDTLAQARDWAAKIMDSDSRVTSVSIRESVQEFDGQPWREGKSVATVRREAEAAQAFEVGAKVQFRTRDGLVILGKVSGIEKDGAIRIIDSIAAYHYVMPSAIVGPA